MELENTLFGNPRGNFELDRKYQHMFILALEGAGFDGNGKIIDERLEKYTDNNKFGEYCGLVRIGYYEVMPYYWGDNEEICNYYNFIDHKNGIKICWYKYPLRDSYINKEISENQLYFILEDFILNVKKELGDIK